MGPSIQLDETAWANLQAHLLREHAEQAAMLFAEVHENRGSMEFVVRDLELLQDSDFDYQSTAHISLTDQACTRAIKRAWESRRSMIEIHSHRGRYALPAFSPSDRSGFAEFVPHVRWRLRGAPYAAMVITEEAFDALAWIGKEGSPVQVDHLDVGRKRLQPSGLTLARATKADYE